MLSPIHTVTIGVADLERSTAFYGRALGFLVHDRGTVPAEPLREAWKIPVGLSGDYAVLAPEGAAAGFLRLIAWSRPGVRIWGEYENYPDLALFAINFRVRDVAAIWARLLAEGAAIKAPLTSYRLGGMDVLDGQCFDPDGVVIDVHEVSGDVSGIEDARDWDCTPVASVSTHPGPIDSAIAFYRKLGFELLYDKELTDLGPFLGFPEGLVLRNANLVMPSGPPHGRVELSDYVGKPAASLTARAVPPNLGLTMLSFRSDDFDADHALLEHAGMRPSRPVMALFGDVWRRSAAFAGPAGESLELFEDLSG